MLGSALAYIGFVLMVYTPIVLLVRIESVSSRQVNFSFFKTMQGEAPEAVIKTTRHLANMFEFPVIFYALVLVVEVLQADDWWFSLLGWVYVVFRIAHCAVHVTYNKVRHRLALFAASHITLVAIFAKVCIAFVNKRMAL